jgi:hypothetical protein
MAAITGHERLAVKLYATGRVLVVDGGHLTLITAGLNAATIIVGFAVFAAIRRTLAFDKRLVFVGYRQATLIAAKTSAIAIVAAAVAAYTCLVLLAFWRPGLSGWLAILAAFTVIALAYGGSACSSASSSGSTLEGFFLPGDFPDPHPHPRACPLRRRSAAGRQVGFPHLSAGYLAHSEPCPCPS